MRGEVRSTAAAYDEAVANYHRTVTQALREVANAGLSQQRLSGRLAKADEALAAAAEAHQISRNRYQGGLATYIEVLSAEDVMLSSLRNLTDLQSRGFALDVALMQALGGGYSEPQHTSN